MTTYLALFVVFLIGILIGMFTRDAQPDSVDTDRLNWANMRRASILWSDKQSMWLVVSNGELVGQHATMDDALDMARDATRG